MKINLGTMDRTLRVLIGIVLATLFMRDDAWRWLGLSSLVMLATAVSSWCPVYRLLGVRTCRINAIKGSS